MGLPARDGLCRAPDPGAIDQDPRRRERLYDVLDAGGDRGRVRDVDLDKMPADPVGMGAAGLLIEIEERDL